MGCYLFISKANLRNIQEENGEGDEEISWKHTYALNSAKKFFPLVCSTYCTVHVHKT